jgi:hypothetical protein
MTMSEPIDERAHLKFLIERHNRFAGQRDGLQDRVDKLDAKIDATRAAIVAEDRRVNGV